MNLKSALAKNYVNFRGWKTNRKIIVIESDDWGSVRIANKEALLNIEKENSQILKSPFQRLDGLERAEDLELLFDVLTKFRDSKGNHPVLTALSLTSNPDFDNIRKSSMEYHSELITQTYNKYGENKLLELWKKEGIKQNLLFPQFHGKEHIHPARYMDRIMRDNDPERLGFNYDSIIGGQIGSDRQKNFLAAFEYHNEEEKLEIEKRTKQGLVEFEGLFGFKSKSFCPSQSIYGNHIYKVLRSNGICTIQAGQQFLPKKHKLKRIDHFWGNKTPNGLVYTRRNCTFETYKETKINHVDQCLKEIEVAFRWGKPAVINSHRINFTSRITPKLRDKTLFELNNLLKEILKKWPDVEFLNSADLADSIFKDSF